MKILERLEAHKIKRKIFGFCELLRNEPVLKKLDELELNQRKGWEYIHNLQLKKMKKLIIYAYENSLFYKNLFNKCGVIPYDMHNLEEIVAFPVLTKEMIRENAKDIVSNREINVYPVKTSGSTGTPLKFFKDRNTSAYSYAAMYRGHRWYGVDVCDKEAYLWGIPLGKMDYYKAKFRDFILNRFREKKFDLTDEVNYDFYLKMVQGKPKILSGYGSLLYEFASYVHKNNLNIEPIKLKMVKYTAEMMYDYQREFVSKLFSCPVVSEYGSAEAGVVAFQCLRGGNHILTDCVCVEFEQDADTKYYKIIVTNLNSYGFPIIRYDTGDLVKSKGLKKCPCGIPFPIIDEIIGRSSDIIVTPEGKRMHSNIFSYIIKEILKKHVSINGLKFIQNKVNELNVHIAFHMGGDHELRRDIIKLIHEKISERMIVDFVDEENIKRDQSGKLRYFISKIDNDESPI